MRDGWHRFRSRAAVLASTAGLLIACGCFQGRSPADLVIVNGQEPESLDPAVITGQADGRVVLALFEGLTRYNARDATPEPGLAERWEISDDALEYRFFLRTNAVWSTGEPITSADFVYSWRRILDPATAAEYAGLLFYVRNAEAYATGKLVEPDQVGFRAEGPHQFVVELVNPTPFFLDLCAFPTLAVVPRKAIETHGDRWILEHPVPVSGAFELVDWRINDRIRLRKNARYWDAANTRGKIIDLLPCTSPTTAFNLYETGLADVVWDKELVPPELADILRQRPDFHRFDYLGAYFFRFNVTRPPLDDVRVRKALTLAIDKHALGEKVLRAGEKVADHFVPPGLPHYESPRCEPFNPDEARRLLAEAGFPNGQGLRRLEYLYNNTGRLHEQIAVELQSMWKTHLGIDIDLRSLEWKTFLRAQSNLEYDLSRSSWVGDYNDPTTFLDLFLSNNGNNRTGWSDPRYDELLRTANAIRDPADRARLLREAEAILIRHAVPIVPIYIYSGLEYYDPARIGGIYSNIRSEHPLRTIYRKTRR